MRGFAGAFRLIGSLALAAVALGCSHVEVSSAPAPADPGTRVPNKDIAAEAAKLRSTNPARLRISFYTADNVDDPEPRPGETEVEVKSPEEIASILRAFESSSHDPTTSEPAISGKDNMFDVSFPDDKDYRRFTIMLSDLDTKWGPTVRAVFDRYLPKSMGIDKYGRLIVLPR